MWQDLLPTMLASFVSGVSGALLGGLILVISLRTDMGWVKDQVRALHERVSRVNQKVDDTREQLFKNLP